MYIETENDAMERVLDRQTGEYAEFGENNRARVTKEVGQNLADAYDDISVVEREDDEAVEAEAEQQRGDGDPVANAETTEAEVSVEMEDGADEADAIVDDDEREADADAEDADGNEVEGQTAEDERDFDTGA